MRVFGSALSGIHTPIGRVYNDDPNNNNPPQTQHQRQANEGDSDYIRKVQLSVATSTFSVIAMMGLFCTCLYLGCCRQKRQRRIRGKTWSPNNNTFALPNNSSNGHILDPNGLDLNPYLISPRVQQQLFGDDFINSVDGGKEGFYHWVEQQQEQNSGGVGNANKNKGEVVGDNLAKAVTVPYGFLPKMQPSLEPASYHCLGVGLNYSHENPGYSGGSVGGAGERSKLDCESVNYAELHSSPYNPDYDGKKEEKKIEGVDLEVGRNKQYVV